MQIRKSRGLSQYELADLAGMSQRMVAHYETVVTNPASNTVLQLAKALKVSVDDLMGHNPVKVKDGLNRKLLKKARLLEELTPSDQETVMRMINTLHPRRKKPT